MKACLRKIIEVTSININLHMIMGWDLCKINKHFLQFPYKTNLNHVDHLTHDKLIYRKNPFDFFLKYPNTHLGKTLLVHNMPYKTCFNPPFNVIFVESYEYALKEDNYLMKTLIPYLEFLHYSRLSVPTFMELYHFNSIRNIKESDVKFRMLFKKSTMACFVSFCKNRLTSMVNSPNFIFCSFLPMFFWIFQSHWFILLVYF
jgi:hypothetical protein